MTVVVLAALIAAFPSDVHTTGLPCVDASLAPAQKI